MLLLYSISNLDAPGSDAVQNVYSAAEDDILQKMVARARLGGN